MGKVFLDSLVAHCRTDAGYTNLKSVVTMEKGDLMPSYFLAETLKYLYLIFAPDSVYDFKRNIFTTEAHPLRRGFTATSAPSRAFESSRRLAHRRLSFSPQRERDRPPSTRHPVGR